MSARIFRRTFFFFPLPTLFLLMSLTCSLSSSAAQAPDKQALADGIIAKVRKATYGEIDVGGIKRLSTRWKTRHQRANGIQDTGESVCDLEMPDKMFASSTRDFSGLGQGTTYKLLNGGQSWSDVKTSGSDIRVIRAGGKPSNDYQAKQLQGMRKEQAVVLMRLALPSAPSFPLTYTFAGEAKANDGQAYVIDVTGPSAFSARLFIDKNTSHIIMITLPESGGVVRTTSSGVSEQLSKGSGEMKFRFYDFRSESGVVLPHLMTYEHDGRIVTEYELNNFKLNPEFAPDHFDPPKKRK